MFGLLAAAVLAAAVLAVAVPASARAEPALSPLEIRTAGGVRAFQVEVADTEASRERGLMFRTEMAPDRGMLFDFRREQPVWFWMKNTYLPLDMIFVTADGTILSIAVDATPLSEAAIPSGGPVRFVLEVVAGTARRLAIRPGDRMVHALVGPAK